MQLFISNLDLFLCNNEGLFIKNNFIKQYN